ncbi:unnamed protein product [Adineta steineri]|uniref:Uncharacterized protein n=1 Tax=Adineta steineri TaxID=433720 RepID=A0A819JZB0_9BILA|nr:unnamed protein product [Adineta steineri]CAF1441165.1 unnamed protein product [Adineta steineri]CAF3939930.1 unnamed protein product [Adineta steineri]CAF3941935.1 unnamed protein product [Adineta steineri]
MAEDNISHYRSSLRNSRLSQLISKSRDVKKPHGSGPLESTTELGYLDSSRIYVDGQYSGLGSELICSICHNVLWKPVDKQIDYRATCPFNCVFREKRVPPILNSLLSKLQFYCAYASNGCEHLLPYDALEKHEETCPYERIPCGICEKPISNRDPNNKHELRECFKDMHDRGPQQIQAQFMKLLDVIEASQRRIEALEKLVNVPKQRK